jgi:membrane protein implicated in regulation of membrane protease activity
MLITAAVLALLGLAQWIGDALGDRLWAGYLIVGWGLLLLVAAGLAAAMVYLQRRFRTQTVNKYDKRRRNQRARFGHDLGQQARGEAERN